MYSTVFKICGINRDLLEKKIGDLLTKLAMTATEMGEEIHLKYVFEHIDEARDVEDDLTQRLGEYIYGSDEDTLEGVVGRLMTKHQLRLAVAESCTGGNISSRITDVPGSSNYFIAGVVSYSNEAKQKLLNVSPRTLLKHGVVSSYVAEEMATGVRIIMDADIGIGVTGIAGPSGGIAEKPVGLVFVAISSVFSNPTERFLFNGTRKEIRLKATQRALNFLRMFLLEEYESIEGEPG